MKIKTKLSIIAIVSIGLALLILITLFLTSSQVQRAIVENRRVDEIVVRIDDLDRATYKHAFRLGEKTGAQWQQENDLLQGLLLKATFNEKEEMAILSRISENQKALSFPQLERVARLRPETF